MDGWTDARKKSIYLVLVQFQSGQVEMLGWFDASLHSHTAEFICEKLHHYVAMIGLAKLACVCSDNASNMKKGRQLVIKTPGCNH